MENLEYNLKGKEHVISSMLLQNFPKNPDELPKIHNQHITNQNLQFYNETQKKEILFPKSDEKTLFKHQISLRKKHNQNKTERSSYFKENKQIADLLIKHKIPVIQQVKKYYYCK